MLNAIKCLSMSSSSLIMIQHIPNPIQTSPYGRAMLVCVVPLRMHHVWCGQAGTKLGFLVRGPEYKQKKNKKFIKLQISINLVLKNYKQKYKTKLLFLNTLQCNYLPTKTTTQIK